MINIWAVLITHIRRQQKSKYVPFTHNTLLLYTQSEKSKSQTLKELLDTKLSFVWSWAMLSGEMDLAESDGNQIMEMGG
jgi:hypothetical protein